jgi:hypothetical protein
MMSLLAAECTDLPCMISSTSNDSSALKTGESFKDEEAMINAVNQVCPNYFLMERRNRRTCGINSGEYAKYDFICRHAGKPRAWVKGKSSKIECPASISFWKGCFDSVFLCTKFIVQHNHPIHTLDETKIR